MAGRGRGKEEVCCCFTRLATKRLANASPLHFCFSLYFLHLFLLPTEWLLPLKAKLQITIFSCTLWRSQTLEAIVVVAAAAAVTASIAAAGAAATTALPSHTIYFLYSFYLFNNLFFFQMPFEFLSLDGSVKDQYGHSSVSWMRFLASRLPFRSS